VEEVRDIWYSKIHPDDLGEMYKMGELYSSGLQEQHSVEFRMKYLDGEYRWVLDRGLAIEKSPDGKVLKVLGIHTDISYIKNLQMEKDRTSRRYQDLIEYSLAMIFTHDLEGNLLSANPAVARILGYEEKEIAGKNVIDFMPEEYRSEIKQKYFSAIEASGKLEGVVRVFSKKGKKIYFLYQNFKRIDESGLPYIICFAQDITKRIEAEKELMTAKKHSEDVARAKENFLATMSHEIRTPMNGVMGITDLLAKTKLNAQQKNYINLIQESSQNLLMIVNDVLDLEKIVLGKLQFENLAFSLSERVGMCVQSFNYKALEKGLEMQFVSRLGEELFVVSDPYRLSQLLNNLISNAIKFTEKGLVLIELFPIEKQGSKWLIGFSIKDTGIGIPAEKLSEIFEPFVQASSSVSRMYGGTGLGLSICNQLIKMMGGQFEVKSELGKGSEFRFSIPFEISSLIPENDNRPIVIDLNLLGRKKVLLVEDVELNQYLARHIMESWGFQVVVAANGKEAVSMIERQAFDLVLMDIQMPVMDGLEATRIIRNMSESQKNSIPIIALTANALRGDSEHYLSEGMNDYLPKPFDEKKLYLKVIGVLGIKLAAGESEQQNEKQIMDSSETNPLFDLAVLNSMAGGDEEFVKEMLSMFVATMPGYLMELINYMEKKDWVNTSRAAHKIKASLHTMCISSLYDAIQEIEDIGKSRKSKKDLPGLVNRVAEVTHQAIKGMSALITG
jgi:PAS domain S-box-containing protein